MNKVTSKTKINNNLYLKIYKNDISVKYYFLFKAYEDQKELSNVYICEVDRFLNEIIGENIKKIIINNNQMEISELVKKINIFINNNIHLQTRITELINDFNNNKQNLKKEINEND